MRCPFRPRNASLAECRSQWRDGRPAPSGWNRPILASMSPRTTAWPRQRRSTAIETDLLRIQAEILRERRSAGRPDRSPNPSSGLGSSAYPLLAATGDNDGDAPWPNRPRSLLRRPALDASANQPCAAADPEFPAAGQPRQRDIRAARAIRSNPRASNSETDFLLRSARDKSEAEP
jgi:hypothetical protein